MSKPRTLSIGSISTGTLRPEDIFPELEIEARQITMSREDRHTAQRLIREFNSLPKDCQTGDDSEILEEMFNLLNSYIPDYCYLGSTSGDGADIGVWPIEELFNNHSVGGYDGCIASSREEALPEHTHALEVNDHGNSTLWRRSGRRWVEVWSIV